MSNNIDFNNLTYNFTSPNIASINFIRFKGPMYSDIKNGNISTEKAEEIQKQFKSKLNEITTGNRKHKKEQLDAITNIKNLDNSR